MTTLNTIIEEVLKSVKPNIRFREDMGGFAKKECADVISQLWQIQENKLRTAITSAIQRAYEAGGREADAKWEREVELMRIKARVGIRLDDDEIGWNNALDTLLSKIRS